MFYETSNARLVYGTRFARGREGIVDKERPGRHIATTDARIAPVDAFVYGPMGQMFERTWTIC